MKAPVEILQEYWGYPSFRPLQEDIINAVHGGRDTLALLPTGGGKSICFQVPGMMSDGLTLVISPLIALMKDQVENLNRRGIAATYINSSMDFREIDRKLQKAIYGKFKFLYCAPERLRTDMLVHRLRKMNVKLLAIDEAHCISQWGYDFRPAYLEIEKARELLPGVPVIALTATATPKVVEDIQEKLLMRNPAIFSKSFRRDNLSYQVIPAENPVNRIIEIAAENGGSGIVYCRTRKRTKIMASYLKSAGISSAAYHGGMTTEERNQVQQDWLDNKTRVIAATNAFGMGIDKPDVRFVCHMNLPQDLESYYQEAGRAGRDGKYAEAICFNFGKDKAELKRWVTEKFPEFETVQRHYVALCDYYRIPNVGPEFRERRFEVADIAKKHKLGVRQFYNSVQLLAREGVINLNENPDRYGEVRLKLSPDAVLVYKNKYPQWEDVLDHILRRLGGIVFSENQRFLPGKWARELEISEEKLLAALQGMKEKGMLWFRPPIDFPTLRFNQHRHNLTRNELSWHKYNFLKDQAFTRRDTLLSYVEMDWGCRSLFLQQYFGEETEETCGICDLCEEENQAKMPESPETRFLRELKTLLADGPQPFGKAVRVLKTGTEEGRKAMVRRLVDRGWLKMDEMGRLDWGDLG